MNISAATFQVSACSGSEHSGSCARYAWAFPNTALGLVLAGTALVSSGRAQIVDGVLEVCGGLADPVLVRLPIAGGAAAITFGHVVLSRSRGMLDVTRRHERVHVGQYERWGALFIPAYLLASAWSFVIGSGAYAGNRFEREAYRHS